MKVTKAVVPCGGLGTRFLPFTKAVAKEMLPIISTPTLDYIVDEIIASGINDILFIISPDKDIIKNYYSAKENLYSRLEKDSKIDTLNKLKALDSKANFSYVYQYDANGSGGAIALAKEFCDGQPFVVANGDDLMLTGSGIAPVTKQLMNTYERYGKSVLAVTEIPEADIRKYGVITTNKDLGGNVFNIDDIIEKPSEKDYPIVPGKLAAMGRYVMTPEIFDALAVLLPGANGELQFTDAIKSLAKKQGGLAQIYDGIRHDMGDRLGASKAIVEFSIKEFGDKFVAYLKELVSRL